MSIMLSISLALAEPRKEPVNLSRMYRAVEQLESGDSHELGGSCCIQRRLWAEFANGQSYANSKDPARCVPIVIAALASLRSQIEAYGYEATPAAIYWAYRRGISGFVRDKFHARTYEGAQRAQNLYDADRRADQ